MPYGFYITDLGRELMDKAIVEGEKVNIVNACFGSGGDPETERDYGITELKNQFYQKTLTPDTDAYKINYNDPYSLQIRSVVPDDVTGTFNEVGFKDDKDNLIIYGVVQEKVKEPTVQGTQSRLQYDNWIKLENGDADKIEIKIASLEMEEIREQFDQINKKNTELEKKDKELEQKDTELNGTITGLQGTVSGFQSTVGGLQSQLETLNSQITSFPENTNIRQLLPSGTQIASGSDDLNSDKFMKVGNYYCPMASTATSLGHCPTTHGFMMEVFYPLNANSYVVRMITDSVGDRWIQSANSRTGSYVYAEWDKLLRESAIKEYDTRITALETLLNGLQETLERLI